MIELKRERGKLTPEQVEWFRDLLAAGVEAYVARPRHLQALAEILACRGNPLAGADHVAVTAAGLREEVVR